MLSLIALELALAPMMILAVRELSNDVTVQRAHDADPGHHGRARLIAPGRKHLGKDSQLIGIQSIVARSPAEALPVGVGG